MASSSPPALHAHLRAHLLTLGCRRGQFACSGDGTHCSLTGTRPDGRAVFAWTFARAFHLALAQYLADHGPPITSQLTLQFDLDADTWHAEVTTRAAAARQAARDAAQELAQRRHAPRDQRPYGQALATQVAAALRQGRWLGYAHRDYCGLGLEYAAGEYRYGEIWDGELQAHRRFADPEAFVQWLAQQSNASLAGLEAKDPWSWDNQTVTRARLLDLVQGPAT